MRKILAVWVTKALILLGKLAGKKGSSTPGAAALKIYPDILRDLSSQVRCDIIAVCGTNGKTTTNNLLCAMLSAQGNKVVCNRVGANMLEGVTTAFADSADLFGRIDADYACIEVDEISTVKVFGHLTPRYMVITNLFRDQLDRYGEIDITVDYLSRAAARLTDAVLILNADDPLVTAFGKKAGGKHVYFGIGEDTGIARGETKEGRFCGFCGGELAYDYYHYSQLGSYRCPGCGFVRPRPDFEAVNVDLTDGIAFDTDGRRISVDYRGFYNIYNILAAYAAARQTGADLGGLQRVLGEYRPQIGRMETFVIGKPVIFNLSKNPAGFNQAISTVSDDKRTKDIVVVINDNAQDGRDISWIWDVDFERLGEGGGTRLLVASGIRHNDVAVRLKYAGLDGFEDIGDVKSAITRALATPSEVLYVLVNYTALFSTQRVLKELEGKQ
ncbi:MAG: MurT ligase domain-containing protein [Clostridiales bacterium]|jgi:UDP-N-acetylmuramyl tripeptide synthase|nr:MurT ligase domain-containing protein [Clostridiales bacterium]